MKGRAILRSCNASPLPYLIAGVRKEEEEKKSINEAEWLRFRLYRGKARGAKEKQNWLIQVGFSLNWSIIFSIDFVLFLLSTAYKASTEDFSQAILIHPIAIDSDFTPSS